MKGQMCACKLIEDGTKEVVHESQVENALRMLNDGTLTLEKVASHSDFSLEEVKELANRKTA